MSAQTIVRWLRLYVTGTAALVEKGMLHEEQGKKAIKGLRYSIKAFEESYALWKAEKRAEEKAEYEAALAKSENW